LKLWSYFQNRKRLQFFCLVVLASPHLSQPAAAAMAAHGHVSKKAKTTSTSTWVKESLKLPGGDESAWCTLYRNVWSEDEVQAIPDELALFEWIREKFQMFGKWCIQGRATCQFGSKTYFYRGSTQEAKPMPKILEEMKARVRDVLGDDAPEFNLALCNQYNTGDKLDYHADNERKLDSTMIASASFGASMFFDLCNNATKEKIRIDLPPGSILVMGGSEMQQRYKHRAVWKPKIVGTRFNVTFRTMKE
jgi:alkylated DNA repair dioxygenase AlkB